jgi:hypothetical protein
MYIAVAWWGWLLIAVCALGLVMTFMAGIYYPFYDRKVEYKPDTDGDQSFPGPPA